MCLSLFSLSQSGSSVSRSQAPANGSSTSAIRALFFTRIDGRARKLRAVLDVARHLVLGKALAAELDQRGRGNRVGRGLLDQADVGLDLLAAKLVGQRARPRPRAPGGASAGRSRPRRRRRSRPRAGRCPSCARGSRGSPRRRGAPRSPLCSQPSGHRLGGRLGAVEIAAHHPGRLDQDLARLVRPRPPRPRRRRAGRSTPGQGSPIEPEPVIFVGVLERHADDQARLGQPVTLDPGEAPALDEFAACSGGGDADVKCEVDLLLALLGARLSLQQQRRDRRQGKEAGDAVLSTTGQKRETLKRRIATNGTPARSEVRNSQGGSL